MMWSTAIIHPSIQPPPTTHSSKEERKEGKRNFQSAIDQFLILIKYRGGGVKGKEIKLLLHGDGWWGLVVWVGGKVTYSGWLTACLYTKTHGSNFSFRCHLCMGNEGRWVDENITAQLVWSLSVEGGGDGGGGEEGTWWTWRWIDEWRRTVVVYWIVARAKTFSINDFIKKLSSGDAVAKGVLWDCHGGGWGMKEV